MKLFISWSGERSRYFAQALYEWLPGVINAVEPWISSSDINPGSRWGLELANELEKTRYGIICITADNMNSPWILFEAGALSRYVEKSRVVPLLLDIKTTDLQGPLAQFQAVQAVENDVLRLVKGVNLTVIDSGERGLDEEKLKESFELWWPRIKSKIETVPKLEKTSKPKGRSDRELIEDILENVRVLRIRVSSISSNLLTSKNTKTILEDFPTPPPDNFPPDWDTEWQPSFDGTSLAASLPTKEKPSLKSSKG